ncbi:hypothetical protein Nmel_012428 [Mimus melanotis]
MDFIDSCNPQLTPTGHGEAVGASGNNWKILELWRHRELLGPCWDQLKTHWEQMEDAGTMLGVLGPQLGQLGSHRGQLEPS